MTAGVWSASGEGQRTEPASWEDVAMVPDRAHAPLNKLTAFPGLPATCPAALILPWRSVLQTG